MVRVKVDLSVAQFKSNCFWKLWETLDCEKQFYNEWLHLGKIKFPIECPKNIFDGLNLINNRTIDHVNRLHFLKVNLKRDTIGEIYWHENLKVDPKLWNNVSHKMNILNKPTCVEMQRYFNSLFFQQGCDKNNFFICEYWDQKS